MNAYDAVSSLREIIGEVTPKYWTEQSLLTALNRSQARLYMKLSMTSGDWLMTSRAITFTNNVAELPTDCAKPSHLQSSSTGEKIAISGNIRKQANVYPSYEGLVSSRRAFIYGKYIETEYTFSGSLTLWYERANRDLHMGTVAAAYNQAVILAADLPAGLATGFKLASYHRSHVADYYNGLMVEYVDDQSRARQIEITDYSGYQGVVILDTTDTLAATATYGMVSCLPAEAWDAWLARAAYIAAAKPAAVVDKEAIRWLKNDMDHAEDAFENWISTRIKDTNYMMEGR